MSDQANALPAEAASAHKLEAQLGELRQLMVCLAEVVCLQATSGQLQDRMLSGHHAQPTAGPVSEATEGDDDRHEAAQQRWHHCAAAAAAQRGPQLAQDRSDPAMAQQQQQQQPAHSSRPRPQVRLELPSEDLDSSDSGDSNNRTLSAPGISAPPASQSGFVRHSMDAPAGGMEAPPMSPRMASMVAAAWAVGRPSLKPSIADIVLRLKAAKEGQFARSNSCNLPASPMAHLLSDSSQLHQAHSMQLSPHTSHAEVHVAVSGAGSTYGKVAGSELGVQQGGKERMKASFSADRPGIGGKVHSPELHALNLKRAGVSPVAASHRLGDRSLSPAPRPRIINRKGFLWDLINDTLVLVKAFAWDVMLPTDPLRMNWDLVVLMLLVYVCVALPYAIAFDIDFADMSQPIAVIDLLVTALFILDAYINVHTAYISDYTGKPVTSRWKIARRYFLGWFWVDAVSCIPFDLILHSQLGLLMLLKIARIIRLVKVLRLLKLLHLTDVLQRIERMIGRAVLQMVSFVVSALTLIHWAACAFYFVAYVPGPDDKNNWLYYNGLETKDNATKYIAALYWSVTTIMTIGYGDIVAYSIAERIVAIVVMLVGGSTFGYFLGAMSTLVAALNTQQARMTARRQAVDDFLKQRKVPNQLSDKIRAFYGYVVEREVQRDEADIIAGLSSSLRTQVVLHLYQEALEKVPFFRGKDPQFITNLVTYLKLEYYAPGDVVVRQGDVGAEMYFIGEGQLEVRVYQDSAGSPLSRLNYRPTANAPKGSPRGMMKKKKLVKRMGFVDEARDARYTVVGQLEAGEYFGEYSCLLGEARGATVVASTYTELYSLSRADLEEVLQQWPELAEEFEAMVHDIKVNECDLPVPGYSSFGSAQQLLLAHQIAEEQHLQQLQQLQQQRPSVPLQQATSVSLHPSPTQLQRTAAADEHAVSGKSVDGAATGGGKWAAMRAALQEGTLGDHSRHSGTQQQPQEQEQEQMQVDARAASSSQGPSSEAGKGSKHRHLWDNTPSNEPQPAHSPNTLKVINNSLYSSPAAP